MSKTEVNMEEQVMDFSKQLIAELKDMDFDCFGVFDHNFLSVIIMTYLKLFKKHVHGVSSIYVLNSDEPIEFSQHRQNEALDFLISGFKKLALEDFEDHEGFEKLMNDFKNKYKVLWF